MPDELNLLPEKARLKFAQVSQAEKWRSLATIILLLFLIFGGLILGLNLYLQSQAKTIEVNIQNAQTVIASYQETERQVLVLKDRLTETIKIMSERKKAGRQLYEVIESLPPESKLKSAKFEKEEIKIQFSLPSFSQAGYFADHYPEQITSELKPRHFEINSFIRQADGSYLIDMSLRL